MSSGTKPGPESDTDSMAEYGEGETGKYILFVYSYHLKHFICMTHTASIL